MAAMVSLEPGALRRSEGGVVIYLGVFVSVVLADIATKLAIDTPAWGWHVVSNGPLEWSAAALCFLLICVRSTRLVGSLFLAAWVDNVLLASPSGVANPFVAGAGGELVAFNLADVAAVSGALILCVVMARRAA